MDYDQRRLIVWPEWASSGLWHPEAGKAVPCPVTMVEHETIGLSSGLSAEFNRWIERYDDYNPPDETFDWDTFDKEGLRLANALALFVGADSAWNIKAKWRQRGSLPARKTRNVRTEFQGQGVCIQPSSGGAASATGARC
jgi:hypothetical protein